MKTFTHLIVAFVSAGAAVLAQGPSDGAAGTHPYVEFRVLKSGPTGTQPSATTGADLANGAPTTALFYTGQSLCSVSIGTPAKDAPADARNVMKMMAELLGEQDGTYSIRLTTQRLRTAGQAPTEPVSEQTVSLREGDGTLLDMVRDASPAGSACSTSALTLEAKLSVRQDPSLAQAVFAADLWFVHRDETGKEWTQHATMNVNGASDSPFGFNDVTFPLPKLDPRQIDLAAFVRLSGTIKARARADGLTNLDLTTVRRVGLQPTASEWRGGAARKFMTVRADETTAIELPQPTGIESRSLDGTGSAAAGGVSVGAQAGAGSATTSGQTVAAGEKVSVVNGRFVLNTTAFFKGHQTRLLVRVHRVR